MRKSREIIYTGNDERIKGIADLLNETSYEYNRILDESPTSGDNNRTGVAAATYKFDEYPSFPRVQCKAVDINYTSVASYDGYPNTYNYGLSNQDPIINVHLGQGKYCRDYEYVKYNQYTGKEGHWRYNGNRESSSQDSFISFDSYVTCKDTYQHYPPYTRSPGIAFQVSGLKPNAVYTFNFSAIDIYPNKSHPHYRQSSTLKLYYMNKLFGVLVDNCHTKSYSVDQSTGFEHLSESFSDYGPGGYTYNSVMDFDGSIPGVTYDINYGYDNKYYDTPAGNSIDSHNLNTTIYGKYVYQGKYISLFKSDSEAHVSSYPDSTKPFSLTTTSSDEGTVNFFLILEALTEPCQIFPFDISISESPDTIMFRDVLIETKNNEQYSLTNPGSQTFIGTENPKSYWGKNGDLYVTYTESVDQSIQVDYMPEGQGSYIWKDPVIYHTTGHYSIDCESNDDPDPSDIISSKYDPFREHDFITSIDDPYVAVQLKNLTPGTMYHMYFRVVNKPNVRSYTPEGSSEPYDCQRCYCGVIYFGNYKLFIEPGERNYGLMSQNLDFYFCPKSSSETIKIITSDMHLFAIPYSNPITARYEVYCKQAKPDSLWVRVQDRWQQLSTGGGGGSDVSILPTLQTGTKIADYSIDGTPNSLYAPTPTDVVANPHGTGTTDLTKLQVGNTIYDIPSGGGSSDLEAVELTKAQYSALTPTEKADPTKIYFLTDGGPDDPEVIITPILQSGTQIATYSIDGVLGTLYAPDGIESVSDIQDVDIDIQTLSDGQILKYNSTAQKWVNDDESTGGASSVSELTDVNLTSLTDGQILKYDATNQEWINADESGGGGPGSSYSRTNLWTGEERGPLEITLSDTMNNYDSIEFVTKLSTNGAYNCIIVDAKSFSTKYPYTSSVSQNIPHYCLLGYDNLFGRIISGSTDSKLYFWDLSSTFRLVEVNGIKYGSGGGSGYTVTELYSGTTITSTTKISDSFDNYDVLQFTTGFIYSGRTYLVNCEILKSDLDDALTNSKWICMGYSSNNNCFGLVSANDTFSQCYGTGNLYSIKGIKYGSGGSGSQSSEAYSTTERPIGTWIDGKTIYRTVLDYHNSPLNGNASVDVTSLNIDTLINTNALGTDNSSGYSGSKWSINSVSSNSNRLIYMSNATTLKVEGSYYKHWIILEYTKTTD